MRFQVYVCPHTTICVLILLLYTGGCAFRYVCPHMCPHTTIYMSSYYCILVDALPGISVLILLHICVLILLYICVLILLLQYIHICPHTTIYKRMRCELALNDKLDAYYYISRMQLYIWSPHTPIHLQCVLILVCICSWRSRTRKQPILRSPRRRKKRRKKAGRAKASWRKRAYLSMGRR